MYVIDASVLVADIRPSEPHHEAAHAFLQGVRDRGCPVYLPAIVLPEIAAAISRGTGDSVLARRFVALIQRIPHFEIVSVDEALGHLAAALAARHAVRGCDAVYVALAEARGARLITLDHQQRERVPGGIPAQSPAEALSNVGHAGA